MLSFSRCPVLFVFFIESLAFWMLSSKQNARGMPPTKTSDSSSTTLRCGRTRVSSARSLGRGSLILGLDDDSSVLADRDRRLHHDGDTATHHGAQRVGDEPCAVLDQMRQSDFVAIRHHLRQRHGNTEGTVMVVDQLEELVTFADPDEADIFSRALADFAPEPHGYGAFRLRLDIDSVYAVARSSNPMRPGMFATSRPSN